MQVVGYMDEPRLFLTCGWIILAFRILNNDGLFDASGRHPPRVPPEAQLWNFPFLDFWPFLVLSTRKRTK